MDVLLEFSHSDRAINCICADRLSVRTSYDSISFYCLCACKYVQREREARDLLRPLPSLHRKRHACLSAWNPGTDVIKETFQRPMDMEHPDNQGDYLHAGPHHVRRRLEDPPSVILRKWSLDRLSGRQQWIPRYVLLLQSHSEISEDIPPSETTLSA